MAVGGGNCWWLVVSVATAAIVALPFDLMHFTILNLSLMYVEYSLCLLITYNIPTCSFTLFFFLQVRYTRTPVYTFVVLVPHMTNIILFIDTKKLKL